jgi:rubrerythrin
VIDRGTWVDGLRSFHAANNFFFPWNEGSIVSRLVNQPPAAVASMAELIAIAHAMETEAARRYSDIGQRMTRSGNATLAAVFERLAQDERGHIGSVERWAGHHGIGAPDPANIRWEIPATFDDEGMAQVDPSLRSAYEALAMAVRNEERAFAFWAYVAAHAPDEEIRKAAEAMAHEELGHVATLRRARREAFHEARQAGTAQERQDRRDMAQTEGSSPFAHDIAMVEERLAQLLRQLADDAAPERQQRLTALSHQAFEHSREALRAGDAWPRAQTGAPSADGLPDNPATLGEWLVEAYLAAADSATDEEEVRTLQDVAGKAIARLSFLRADLPAALR